MCCVQADAIVQVRAEVVALSIGCAANADSCNAATLFSTLGGTSEVPTTLSDEDASCVDVSDR